MQLLLVSFSACTPVAGIVRLTPALPFLHVRPCGNCACSARATGAVSSATHASRKHAHAYPVLRYPLRKIIVPAGARPYSDPTRRPGLRGCGSTTRRSSVRSIHQPDASTRARYSSRAVSMVSGCPAASDIRCGRPLLRLGKSMHLAPPASRSQMLAPDILGICLAYAKPHVNEHAGIARAFECGFEKRRRP